MNKIYVVLFWALLMASCGGRKDEPHDRPGKEPAVNPELADASMRISGSLLTMRYEDGGILFSRDSKGVISAVRLSDECRFEFDPSLPSLRINGGDVPLVSAELLQQKDGCSWHRLTVSGENEVVYIVTAGL